MKTKTLPQVPAKISFLKLLNRACDVNCIGDMARIEIFIKHTHSSCVLEQLVDLNFIKTKLEKLNFALFVYVCNFVPLNSLACEKLLSWLAKEFSSQS